MIPPGRLPPHFFSFPPFFSLSRRRLVETPLEMGGDLRCCLSLHSSAGHRGLAAGDHPECLGDASVPDVAVAPARFSTINCWPRRFRQHGPSGRRLDAGARRRESRGRCAIFLGPARTDRLETRYDCEALLPDIPPLLPRSSPRLSLIF